MDDANALQYARTPNEFSQVYAEFYTAMAQERSMDDVRRTFFNVIVNYLSPTYSTLAWNMQKIDTHKDEFNDPEAISNLSKEASDFNRCMKTLIDAYFVGALSSRDSNLLRVAHVAYNSLERLSMCALEVDATTSAQNPLP